MEKIIDEEAVDQSGDPAVADEVSDEALEAAAAHSTGADPTGHETGSKACC